MNVESRHWHDDRKSENECWVSAFVLLRRKRLHLPEKGVTKASNPFLHWFLRFHCILRGCFTCFAAGTLKITFNAFVQCFLACSLVVSWVSWMPLSLFSHFPTFSLLVFDVFLHFPMFKRFLTCSLFFFKVFLHFPYVFQCFPAFWFGWFPYQHNLCHREYPQDSKSESHGVPRRKGCALNRLTSREHFVRFLPFTDMPISIRIRLPNFLRQCVCRLCITCVCTMYLYTYIYILCIQIYTEEKKNSRHGKLPRPHKLSTLLKMAILQNP